MKSLSLMRILYFLIVIFSFSLHAVAQKSEKYYELQEQYRKATDLFSKEKYAAAQVAFGEIIRKSGSDQSEVASEASYHYALCGLMMFNNNAEELLMEFIEDHPSSPRVNRAYFDLGRHLYRKSKFNRALYWFEKVNVFALNSEEVAEFYFKSGYSYFREDKKEEALRALYEIKDAESKYSVMAKYYFAHLSYEAGNNETALKYFREIEEDETFSTVVPYYITQILYSQKNYEEVTRYAGNLLDSGKTQRDYEIAKLLGESHFRLGNYEMAVKYLGRFIEAGIGVKPEDYCQIATAFSNLKEDGKAVLWYQKGISGNDSLDQVIYYKMAQSYLLSGDKQAARNSMRMASKTGSDGGIRENALYAYAKLSYELSQYPFNDAVSAFEDYINSYPRSANVEEANEYLVAVYFSTKNYAEAKKSLERINNRSLKLNIAYHKILLYLALENMKRGLLEEAMVNFDQVISMDFDRTTRLDGMFWKADVLFRLLRYDESAELFSAFLLEAGAMTSPNYSLAQYNLAYSYFRLRDYKSAIFRFRQYVEGLPQETSLMKSDACLRTADAFFITRNYENALEYYDRTAGFANHETDYAIFQAALVSGVMADYDGKIKRLSSLTTAYPTSPYCDDAIFELGDIYFIRGLNDSALIRFDYIINKMKQSPYYYRSMLKSGLISFNRKDDAEALRKFEIVIRENSTSGDARQAIEKVKQIFIYKGDLAGFEAFMAGIGTTDMAVFSMDSASYEIAENSYMEGRCDEATRDLTAYLEKYPEGNFRVNAHFYRGDCELRAGRREEALQDFERVVATPNNLFTEKSLAQSAALSRELGDKRKAVDYYRRLVTVSSSSSQSGNATYWLMKLSFALSETDSALKYAKQITARPEADPKFRQEAMAIAGNIYLARDDYNNAHQSFSGLFDVNSEAGAEGRYNLAYIEFMRGNLDTSEYYINLVLNQSPSYDYWIAKSFLLWAAIYEVKGDSYQSRASLQAVADNYKGEDLVKIAREKLAVLDQLEESEKKRMAKKEKKMEIEFTGDENYDHLFDEEVINE